MGQRAKEIEELAQIVETLPSSKARRVARLVLECRASLRDALAAVRHADSVEFRLQAARVPLPHPRLFRRLRACYWRARCP